MNKVGTPRKKVTASTKAGAGAAGAGSGTLLVLLANNLPDSNRWKSWLVLLAPSLTIAITVAYTWIRKYVDDYLDERRIKRFISEAKVTLREALENPNTSEAHRRKLRAQLEELELLLVRASIEKVRVVDEMEHSSGTN